MKNNPIQIIILFIILLFHLKSYCIQQLHSELAFMSNVQSLPMTDEINTILQAKDRGMCVDFIRQ
jgi:hypothetical protein